MGARIASLAFPVSLGCFVATEAFAYAMRLDPVLGVPIYRHGIIAVYAPWKIAQWAWWWGSISPVQFLWPAMVGVAAGLWVWTQLISSRPRKPQAHWATNAELAATQCFARVGIVLGVIGWGWWTRVVRYGGGLHVLFLGQTGGGKTSTLTSTLLEYPHSMLIMDPARELYEHTRAYRATRGHIYFLAPTESVTDTYNFWDRVVPTSATAFREVELLSHYLLEQEDRVRESSAGLLFRGLAIQFLNGLSFYGLTTGLATCGEDFHDLVCKTDWTNLCQSLREHDHPVVQDAGNLGLRGKGDVHESLYITIVRALSIFSDPQIAAMTRTTSFQLSGFREAPQPCTVYWHVPFRDQARLRRLTRLFFHQVLDYCTEPQFREEEGRRPRGVHPVVWVAEELPILKYFPLASEGLNYFRKYGIQLLLLTPSMTELAKEFGQDHNFLEGTYVKCIFGLRNARTARTFAEDIGDHAVVVTRTTHQRGGRVTSTEERQEALLDATGITKLPRGHVLVMAGEHARVVRQAPFHRRRIWRTRSQLPVPTKEG